MSRTDQRVVLFLGNDDRARAAASHFDVVAQRMGLPYAVESSAPGTATDADIARAAAVVAFVPLDPVRFPSALEKAEVWHVPLTEIEGEVMDLIARLLGGRNRDESAPAARLVPKPVPARKSHTVRIGREIAGRRGKGVTTIWDLPLSEDGVKELAAALKQKCGTGGTVKDGKIEIQGDHRDRIEKELEKLGYKVKRSGG